MDCLLYSFFAVFHLFASGKFCVHLSSAKKEEKKKEHNEADHMINSFAVNDMSYVKHWTLYYIVCEDTISGEIAILFERQLINMGTLLASATKLPSLRGSVNKFTFGGH